MKPPNALSIPKKIKRTLEGRKVAILFDEGSDKAEVSRIMGEIETAGGSIALIAPKVGRLKVNGGMLKADGQLGGSPSVLFDAVALVLMPDAVARLSNDSVALSWLMDAYARCKTIGHCKRSLKLIERLGIEIDDGVVPNAQFAKVAHKRHWLREPKVRMLA